MSDPRPARLSALVERLEHAPEESMVPIEEPGQAGEEAPGRLGQTPELEDEAEEWD